MESFEKYYTLAIVYLTRRPHSEKELTDYLIKKAKRLSIKRSEYILNPALLAQVIARLKEQNFLSDLEFARWWKEQRNRFRPKSDMVIKMELKQKGISPSLIEQVFEEKGDEALSDSEKANKLIEKQFIKVANLTKHQQYQKLGGFLARRGFSWEVTRRAIDEIRTKTYNKD